MYKIIYAQNKFETQKKNWKQYDELSTLQILKLKSGYKNIILHGQNNVCS